MFDPIEFLKQNQHILHSKRGAKRKLKNSPGVIDIINLDDDMPVSTLNISKTVDLTHSEPELIVLDDTVDYLNKTISGLNVSLSDISNVSLELMDLNTNSGYSLKKSKRLENEVDISYVETKKKKRKRKRKPLNSSCNLSNNSGSVLSPKVKRRKKIHERIDNCKSNLTINVNSSGLRSIKENEKSLKSSTSKSPINMTPNKKYVNNISSNCSSPATKPLSGNALKYYSKLKNVVTNLKGRKCTLNRKTLHSPIKAHQIEREKRKELKGKRRCPAALQNHNDNLQFPRSRKPVVEMNMFNPNPLDVDIEGFRPVVIDGSNVARGHGKGSFSVKGIQICVDYFARRSHKVIKVFLPVHCEKHFTKEQLADLRTKCDIVFTPSLFVNGVRKTPYDDRFIVQYAVEFGGVIVSTDNYRDLMKENPKWRNTIEKRLLMFTWVDDVLMFPMDPLGSTGPTLEQFLRF